MALGKEAFQWGSGSVGAVRLDDLVWDWKRALARQECSPTTIQTYGWALRGFCAFAARRRALYGNQLQRELIEEWQDDCRIRLSRRSRSTVSVAVRQFLRWGVGQGAISPRAPYWVTHVKGVRGVPRPIPPESLQRIIGHLASRQFVGWPVELRDRALFLFVLTTGARVSEALQVKRSEVSRAIVQQKGGGEKDLDVPPIVVEAIEEYLASRRDSNPWMWVTMTNNQPMRPLLASSVREIWRRLAARLNIPPWTTHQLRHTGASELYEAGIDVLVTADWLGHKGTSHVQQYARVSRRRRREAQDVLQAMIERYSVLPRPILWRKR